MPDWRGHVPRTRPLVARAGGDPSGTRRRTWRDRRVSDDRRRADAAPYPLSGDADRRLPARVRIVAARPAAPAGADTGANRGIGARCVIDATAALDELPARAVGADREPL